VAESLFASAEHYRCEVDAVECGSVDLDALLQLEHYVPNSGDVCGAGHGGTRFLCVRKGGHDARWWASGTGSGTTVNQAVQDATKAGTAAAADLVKQAEQYLEQAKQYIKENKLDAAEQAIAKVEAMKDKLPAEWAAKIDDVRKMLDSAKKAVGACRNAEVITPDLSTNCALAGR